MVDKLTVGFTKVKETDSKTYSRFDVAQEQAKAKGLQIILPGSRELFVDIDSHTARAVFNANIGKLLEVEPADYRLRPSPSGVSGREHAVVVLHRRVNVFERIALQAALGSDPIREMLSWQRAKRGDKNPTLFFEKMDYVPFAPKRRLAPSLWDKVCSFFGRRR